MAAAKGNIMATAGRKPKTLTPEQLSQVEALAAFLSQEQIADYFGVGKTTWFAMMERSPEISERYKRGKARAIGSVAKGLLQKARSGDTASAIFYLKTQAGWREKDRDDEAMALDLDAKRLAVEKARLEVDAMNGKGVPTVGGQDRPAEYVLPHDEPVPDEPIL